MPRQPATSGQRALLVRQLAVLGWVGFFAATGLANLRNLGLVFLMDFVWEVLWYWCKFLTRGLRISAVRLLFIMHVLLVQVGLVTIYIFAQDTKKVGRLYLGFAVHPSLQAVVFPTLFMTVMLLGVWLASIGRDQDGLITHPHPLGRIHRRRALVLFFVAFVWGTLAFARAGFPLLSSLRGSAETTRLEYHYGGSASVLFNASIVAQTYLAIGPFVVFALWRSSPDRSLRRFIAYLLGAGLLFLVANSLERTTPAILAVWFLLATLAAGRKPPKGILVGGPLAFLAGTLVLHGGAASFGRILELQVFRRVVIVNAMVNYFAVDKFGSVLPFRFGQTYGSYFGAIARGGGGFSHELITIVYPGTIIGTAPVGMIAEFWVNFGYASLLAAPLIGFALRSIDRALARRNGDGLGHVLWAGVATLVGTMSYAAPLGVLFSGGLLFAIGTYVLCEHRPIAESIRPRATLRVG